MTRISVIDGGFRRGSSGPGGTAAGGRIRRGSSGPASTFRRGSAGPGELERMQQQIFFEFRGEKVFARTHLTEQPLKVAFEEKYRRHLLGKLFYLQRRTITRLVGEELAAQAFRAIGKGGLEFSVDTEGTIKTFNFYVGAAQKGQGKEVVLIEFRS